MPLVQELTPFEWLLGGAEPRLVVGLYPGGLSVMDLSRKAWAGELGTDERAWAELLPGERLADPMRGLIVLAPVSGLLDESYLMNLLNKGSFARLPDLRGTYWSEDTVTVLSSHSVAPQGGRPYKHAQLERGTWVFETRNGQTGWFLQNVPIRLWEADSYTGDAAFLSDGTAVVVLDDRRLTLISPQGQAREIPAIKPWDSAVSVGSDDTILAFETRDQMSELVMLKDGHEQRIALGKSAPMQIPLALPGGRVVAVTDQGVLSSRQGKKEWQWRYDFFPESLPAQEPEWDRHHTGWYATGTLDGAVVLRWKENVVALDDSGRVIWRMTVPGVITTNPLVTADGGVCVGMAGSLVCDLPS